MTAIKRKDRYELARKVGKEVVGSECTSFGMGVKWADYHPYWQEGIPEPSENENGLPKLYLCQILTCDMTFGYRYSYRTGFINDEGNWSIERDNCHVVRYLEIFANETREQLLEDIKKLNNINE